MSKKNKWKRLKRGEISKRNLPGYVFGQTKGVRLPEYHVWRSMKYRCVRETHYAYKDYGGRGITVCQQWLDSFQCFMNDMGFRPSPEHTLDRIDNDGNYEPSNCEWRTMKEQSRNRRNNTWLEYDGKRMTRQEWIDYLGASKANFYPRGTKSFAEQVEYHLAGRPNKAVKITYNGDTKKISEWAQDVTICEAWFRELIKKEPFEVVYNKYLKK